MKLSITVVATKTLIAGLVPGLVVPVFRFPGIVAMSKVSLLQFD
jgi:hypothetical protein